MRWVLRIAIALVVVLAIAAGAIELYTRSAGFHRYLRAKLVSFFDATYEGKLAAGEVSGSLWRGITVRDAAVSIDGRRVLAISRLEVRLSLVPLLWRQVYITRLVAEQPRIDLRRVASGRWGLVAAFAERPPVSPSSLSVRIARLQLNRAQVRVEAGAGRTYALDDGELRAGIYLGPHATRIRVRHLAGLVAGPRLPAFQLDTAFILGVRNGSASLALGMATFRTQASSVSAHGSIRDFKKGPYDLSIDLTRLAGADLARIAPAVHLAQDLTGTLELRGSLSTLKAEARVATGPARATATVKADLSGREPRYAADVSLSGVNPAEFMPHAGLAATVGGRWHLSGAGLSFAALQAEGKLAAKGLRWRAYQVGEVDATASLRDRALNFQGQLSGPAGIASYSAKIKIAGSPTYGLKARFVNFDPNRLAATIAVPPSKLNFTLEVSGNGASLARMNAQGKLEVASSRVGAVAISGGRVEAALANGYLDLRQLALRASGTSAGVSGRFHVLGQPSGRLDYTIGSSDIAPWLKLAGLSGGGAMDLRGNALGSTTDLAARGTLSLRQASLASLAVGSGRVDYDLSGLGIGGGSSLRRGSVEAKLANLKAGVLWREVTAQATLRGAQGVIAADLKLAAQHGKNHRARLDTAVTYGGGRLASRVDHLSFALADGEWSLSRPATLQLEHRRFSVTGFALNHRRARLAVDGTLAAAGSQDLRLVLTDLPIAEIQAQLGRRLPAAGAVSAEVRLGGTAAAPLIDARIDTKMVEIAGARYAGLQAQIDYGAGAAHLSATLAQDSRHSLNAQGMLPMTIGWAGGWRFETTGPANVHVSSAGLSLAFLDAFVPPSFGRISGLLELEVTAAGPLDKLAPQGSLQLRQVAFGAAPLGLRVSELAADVAFAPGSVSIRELTARAGKGSLRASGNVILDGVVPRQVALRTTLDRWPAIDTPRYKVDVAGNIDMAGPLKRLGINGTLRILSANLKPNLKFVGSGAITQVDRTIKVIRPTSGAQPQTPAPKGLSNLPTFRSLAMQLNVNLGSDAWIRQGESGAQVTGDLAVQKNPYQDLTVSGTVRVIRGSVVIANQRFSVRPSQLVFAGGHPIDPLLYVSADKRVPGYTVIAQIRGTARKPNLTLQSQPELPQSQILSLLLFGTPVQNLTGSQKQTLQAQATSMAAGFAGSEVAQSVAQALGLGGLGVSVQGGAVGVNVTPGLYLSAGQDVSGTSQGGKAAIDYDLTRYLQLRTSTSTVNGNQIELRLQTNY